MTKAPELYRLHPRRTRTKIKGLPSRKSRLQALWSVVMSMGTTLPVGPPDTCDLYRCSYLGVSPHQRTQVTLEREKLGHRRRRGVRIDAVVVATFVDIHQIRREVGRTRHLGSTVFSSTSQRRPQMDLVLSKRFSRPSPPLIVVTKFAYDPLLKAPV